MLKKIYYSFEIQRVPTQKYEKHAELDTKERGFCGKSCKLFKYNGGNS
jgi:hypothetical protein